MITDALCHSPQVVQTHTQLYATVNGKTLLTFHIVRARNGRAWDIELFAGLENLLYALFDSWIAHIAAGSHFDGEIAGASPNGADAFDVAQKILVQARSTQIIGKSESTRT